MKFDIHVEWIKLLITLINEYEIEFIGISAAVVQSLRTSTNLTRSSRVYRYSLK